MAQSKGEPGGMAGAQAIRRAMDVVRAVTQFQRSGATLSRVAGATGLSTSTAHRNGRRLRSGAMPAPQLLDWLDRQLR